MTAMASETKAAHFSECLASEFDRQEDCDVLFCVDGETVGAHKFMFRMMKPRCQGLYDMAMEWKAGDVPILVDNMDYNSLRILLRYIYTNEIAISNENVFVFLSAAVQWKMHHLEELCTEFISNSMGEENVCFYMNEAVNFESTALQQKCHEIFSRLTFQVMCSEAFLKLSQPALSAFLDTESTNVIEIVLFFFVKWWIKKQCDDEHLTVNGTNMRKVLGDALYKIRFPTMTVQDFANSVTTIKGLLTDTEMAQIFQKITVFCSEGLECSFPTKFRCEHNYLPTPSVEADELLRQKILTLNGRKHLCDFTSAMNYVKKAPNGEEIIMTPFRILLQCWSDLVNSLGEGISASGDNQAIRNQLFDEFCILQGAANPENNNDIMTKYVDFRHNFDRLCLWL